MDTPQRMFLDALTPEDMEEARQWRLHRPEAFRTPYRLTRDMQQRFYQEVVGDRRAPHRYFAVRVPFVFVALGGLTNIEWENGLAEISLVVAPERQREGAGWTAAQLICEEGFQAMRLLTIVGECYRSNPSGVTFWQRFTEEHKGDWRWLPRRKFWNGQLHDALYFTLMAETWPRDTGQTPGDYPAT